MYLKNRDICQALKMSFFFSFSSTPREVAEMTRAAGQSPKEKPTKVKPLYRTEWN